jgi:hypothetical protein
VNAALDAGTAGCSTLAHETMAEVRERMGIA